jgi:hypothetical protein
MDLLSQLCAETLAADRLSSDSPTVSSIFSSSGSSTNDFLTHTRRPFSSQLNSNSLIQEFDYESSDDFDNLPTRQSPTFVNVVHAVQQQELATLDDEQEATSSLEDDVCTCESIFTGNGNCIHTLLSMACGIKHEDDQDNTTPPSYIADFENDELFTKSKKKKKFKPTKKFLIEEVTRRKRLKGETARWSQQSSNKEYIDWLKDNDTYVGPGDLLWLRSKISWFRSTLTNAQEAEGNSEDVARHIQFRGTAWILRVIHCFVDHDDAKLAFATAYDVLDRQALDSRHSPLDIVKTVFEIIA